MQNKYQYVKIHGYYLCIQQNPAVLAWLLYFKRDDLHSILKGWLKINQSIRGLRNYLRYYYGLIVNNSKTLILFLLYQWSIRKPGTDVELPVYGQVCKPVHQGYKVFNLQNRVVTKVFDSDVRIQSILSEIELLKKFHKLRLPLLWEIGI